MISVEDQISILAHISKADHVVAEEEYRLILFFAKNLGLAEERAKELIEEPNPIPSFKSLPTEDKFLYLFDIIKMMKVDGKVHPNEVSLCEKLAIKLGYKPGVVADLSQFVYSDPTINTNQKKLWSIAEKHLIPFHEREN
jgi:hypothetical protein